MTPEEFKGKVNSYYSLVLDGHLSKDDAEDAINDCITAVKDCEQEQCHDYHEKKFVETFYGRVKYL